MLECKSRPLEVFWIRRREWVSRPGARAFHVAGGCLGCWPARANHALGSVDGGAFAAPALCQAIAVAVHFEDIDVMGQPVEQRAGQAFWAEGLGFLHLHSLHGQTTGKSRIFSVH